MALPLKIETFCNKGFGAVMWRTPRRERVSSSRSEITRTRYNIEENPGQKVI